MKSNRWSPLLVALGALSAGAAASAEVSESRVIEETFVLAEGGRLVVDNVFGSVRVTGVAGNDVRVRAVETIEADDAEALERARLEVELLTEASAELVDLYVDGPFRDRDRRGWSRRYERRRYRVSYDLELEVPAAIGIELSTVTDGEIVVAGVHGDFEISNVNGGIDMRDLQGSGSIRTVNGPIRAEFSRGPLAASDFKTVNGDVEVFFPADLSAELELVSRWGELWSEFEVVSVPTPPATRRTEAGKTIIKIGGPVVRVARGGPRLSFETLNGDVLIRKHDKGETR